MIFMWMWFAVICCWLNISMCSCVCMCLYARMWLLTRLIIACADWWLIQIGLNNHDELHLPACWLPGRLTRAAIRLECNLHSRNANAKQISASACHYIRHTENSILLQSEDSNLLRWDLGLINFFFHKKIIYTLLIYQSIISSGNMKSWHYRHILYVRRCLYSLLCPMKVYNNSHTVGESVGLRGSENEWNRGREGERKTGCLTGLLVSYTARTRWFSCKTNIT